jgi:hypothetical protein
MEDLLVYRAQALKMLVGETITEAYANSYGPREDGRSSMLAFVTLSGKRAVFHADGDCCSAAYFENIDLKRLAGATIDKITVGDREDRPPSEQEEDHANRFLLHTDRGIMGFDLRSSSNGYYGAYLSYVGERVTAAQNGMGNFRPVASYVYLEGEV